MKDKSAVSLGARGGKARWKNKTPEEKSLHGKKMRQARTEKSESTPSN